MKIRINQMGMLVAVTTVLVACGGGGGGSTPATPSAPISSEGATASAPTTGGGTSAPVVDNTAVNAAVENAKVVISATMKDPASTTFQKLTTYRIGSDDTVCGEVNAKNGFGAYVGYKAFYYRPYTDSAYRLAMQSTSTGIKGDLVDYAKQTLITTVCANITRAEADAALTTYLQTITQLNSISGI